jgi:hypothetical protein
MDDYPFFKEWGELMLLHYQLKKLAEKREQKAPVEKAKTVKKEKSKASGKE